MSGANGHLGNNLVRTLLARGGAERVRASVRNINNKKPFKGLDGEVVYADLLDKDSLMRALEGVDTLYQVAAVFKHCGAGSDCSHHPLGCSESSQISSGDLHHRGND